MTLPALRHIDVFPVEHEGQQYICLRDPDGVVEEQLMLTPPAFFIACQLDGKNDIVDIQYAFAKQFAGHIVLADDIHRIVTYLDANGFLWTERFAALQQRIVDEFTTSPVRPAYLANKSYPAQPGQLRSFLDHFFVRDGGPGPCLAAQRWSASPLSHCTAHRFSPWWPLIRARVLAFLPARATDHGVHLWGGPRLAAAAVFAHQEAFCHALWGVGNRPGDRASARSGVYPGPLCLRDGASHRAFY